jgi:hypothetical protein
MAACAAALGVANKTAEVQVASRAENETPIAGEVVEFATVGAHEAGELITAALLAMMVGGVMLTYGRWRCNR